MNGPHDLGGMMGFGPVAPEPGEPLFHAPWHRRALALSLAMGPALQCGIDASRHAREKTPPADYWSLSYYEIWIEGLTRLIEERGLLRGAPQELPRLEGPNVAGMLARGSHYTRAVDRPARFAIGAKVRARNWQPPGHTRLPAYLRGCGGIILRHHGAHVYPDANAHGRDDPQHLYTVRFKSADVFGGGADEIQADLFEPYLEMAA
jgi:nitrile hydratase subunit beta